MGTKTSTASGLWSAGATWVGGVAPVDDDDVVIEAGDSVLMDADTSAFTGLRSVTIQGHATTPAMLYFTTGTSGYLKIRTGYSILGTSGTLKGRLLANSDGVWGNTGALPFADKAVIDLVGTTNVNCQYLDVALYCTQPTNNFVRTYGTKYDFTASGATVDVTNNIIDLGVAPPAAGTAVMITTASGTLPTGLYENTGYYVRTVSGNTCKLAGTNADSTIIDITGTGSGTCTLFTGHTSTSTAVMNVLDDVSADTPWTTTDGHDWAVLVNTSLITTYDTQKVQLSAIAAGTITLNANVDSAQSPGARIYLSSRNVSVRTNCTTNVLIFNYASATTASGVFQCEIRSTAGTNTTYNGTGISSGTGHTISGVITGCTNGVISCTTPTVSGVALANSVGASTCTTATVSGHVAGNATGISASTSCTHSGVFFGNSTHFNGEKLSTISGTVVGGSVGMSGACYSCTVSGTMAGISSGINVALNTIMSGTIRCSSTPINLSQGTLISGRIENCGTAFNQAREFLLTGVIDKCTTAVFVARGRIIGGTLSNNTTDFAFSSSSGASPLDISVYAGSTIPNPPIFSSRNVTGTGKRCAGAKVGFENYLASNGASYAFQANGDIIKDTSVLRTGGATSSIRAEPQSNCAVNTEMLLLEWEEMSVPASAQTRTIYVKGASWVSFPTNAQLYLEADYYSSAGYAITTVASTEVISDNTTWVALNVSFTPSVVGHVRYRAYLGAYVASGKIYIDNALYRTGLVTKHAAWKDGMSALLADQQQPPFLGYGMNGGCNG